MQDFDKEVYKEEEVNQIIKRYFEDFALIRRELINFGYLTRSPLNWEYAVVKRELSEQELEKIEKLQKRFEDY